MIAAITAHGGGFRLGVDLPRPNAIRVFEALSAASVLIALTAVPFLIPLLPETSTNVQATALGAGIVLGLAFYGAAFALILLISRRRSIVAKWTWVMLLVLGISDMIASGVGYSGWPFWASTASAVISAMAVPLLFLPSARSWFRRDDLALTTRETLKETFR